jgi:hypothetical protein
MGMSRFAVAIMLHKKECGPYSRTLHESLAVVVETGDNKYDAAKKAFAQVEASHPPCDGWQAYTWEATEVAITKSSVSKAVRLPDGTDVAEWSMTLDTVTANRNNMFLETLPLRSGMLSWSVDGAEITQHWECHFSALLGSDTLIEPVYDEQPRLVEMSVGIERVWPR